jgi:23S rRNA (cytidine1920-2'-O)/16S rRNA (cytidine1409-2'-O)-methyltransferase
MVERGLSATREQARGLILSGLVRVNGDRVDKAGHPCAPDVSLSVDKPLHNYVSRGGLKLEKAITDFSLSVQDRIVLDVGASTGGFTDCALQFGARNVVAVDVGSGQLAWKLRNDPRVSVLEKTNVRYLKAEDLPVQPDLAVIDVSFISLELILPVIHSLLTGVGSVVALIKPQFEAGRELASKGKGVIRDPEIHRRVIQRVFSCSVGLGWTLEGLTHSPIKGPEGNIEFIAYWSLTPSPSLENDANRLISDVVSVAHKELSGEG